MEKLLKAEDVARVLQVSQRTAHSYMQQMAHMTGPIRVQESALREWIAARTVRPGEKAKKPAHIKPRRHDPEWRIPMRRPGRSPN